jgi:hypothetical protein
MCQVFFAWADEKVAKRIPFSFQAKNFPRRNRRTLRWRPAGELSGGWEKHTVSRFVYCMCQAWRGNASLLRHWRKIQKPGRGESRGRGKVGEGGMRAVSPKPLSIPLGPFEFFRKFAEIFAAQGAPPVSLAKIFNQKSFNNIVWTPLGSRVNI